MAAVAVLFDEPLATLTDPTDGRELLDYVVFVIGMAITGAVYLVVAWVLRVPELGTLLAVVERRLGRRLLPRR